MPDPLDAIRPDETGEVDQDAQFEELLFRRQTRSYQLEERRHALTNLKQDIALRKSFALGIAIFVIVWFLIVLAIVASDGFRMRVDGHDFVLANSIILALIGSTTANVIGILLIVVHYLFPH